VLDSGVYCRGGFLYVHSTVKDLDVYALPSQELRPGVTHGLCLSLVTITFHTCFG
jgi:hypothetical protein